MYKTLTFIFLFISLSIVSQNSKGKNILVEGKVIGIIDGDTFKLLTQDLIQIKVRLANIDCPENKQPFSSKAKQFVSDAIFGKQVTIHVLKKDRYGRSIANVNYDDSLDLSQELLKQGLAWHYLQYSKDPLLQKLEDQAKKEKLGLWKDKDPIPPWEWRKNEKKKS